MTDMEKTKAEFARRTVEIIYDFGEHHQWVLKYDAVMEYWMVCKETDKGWKVLTHSKDILEAMELALDDEERDK